MCAQPKKLTYVLNRYSPSDASHFSHVLHLLEELAEQGCEIQLVIEKPEAIPRPRHGSIRVVGMRTKPPLLRQIELFRTLRTLIQHGYETTFVRISAPASITASIAHRLFGGRSYLWQSGTTYEYDRAKPLSRAKIGWYLSSHLPSRLARRLAHRFVTGPESMVDYYVNTLGVPRKKIRLLYNDVDTTRFAPSLNTVEARATFLASRELEPDCLILLLVHRLSPVRRTLMFLESILPALASRSARRPWVLVVAGDGPERNAAEALAAKLSVQSRCVFLGDVPNREIMALYSIADIFIHPTFAEGFSRVLIEAMAAALPVVTTDAGGTQELFGVEQQAYIVDRRNPGQFTERLLELMGSPDRWNALSAENRAAVSRFATPVVATMYLRTLFE